MSKETLEDFMLRMNQRFEGYPLRPSDTIIMMIEYAKWKEQETVCDHVWRHDHGIKGPRCTRCGQPGEKKR